MINNCTVDDMYAHLAKACELEAKALTYSKLYSKIQFTLTQLQNTMYYCDTAQSGENSVIYNEKNQENFIKNNSKRSILERLFSGYIVIYFAVMVIAGIVALVFEFGSSKNLTEYIGPIIGLVLVGIFLMIFIIRIGKRKKSKINEADKQFQLNKIRHEKKYYESQNLKAFNKKEIEKYSLTLLMVRDCYLRVTNERDTFYSSHNILPVGYRNYIAVTTLFYWLDIRSCTELYGHGGLFDTYENRKKYDEIITELKIANQLALERNRKMDTMIENQKIMISTLRTANEIAEKTYQAVENVNQNVSSMNDYARNIDSTLRNMNDRDMTRFYFR